MSWCNEKSDAAEETKIDDQNEEDKEGKLALFDREADVSIIYEKRTPNYIVERSYKHVL